MTAGVDPAGPGATEVGTGTVRAREAPVEPPREGFRERVSTSIWFVPAVFTAGAFLLSRITIEIDRLIDADESPTWLIGGGGAGSIALAATVATAMLTFLAVLFATTLVAIQLAGGQYSPRVVRIFIRSPITHATLGVFIATFVFALNALVELGEGGTVPRITVAIVYLMVLATLAIFIAFLHGMTKILRVQYLLERVADGGRRVVVEAFPPDDTYFAVAAPLPAPGAELAMGSHAGVVQAVDRLALVRLAADRNAWIDLHVEVGEYVRPGGPIGEVHGAPLLGHEIASCLLLGGERTLLQDPGFTFRMLVDVAIRALSPAVNDPTTAVQAVDRIVALLALVVSRPDPDGWYLDDNGTARLRCREPGVARLIVLGFAEIIRYGADSPQVARRLRAAFDELDGMARPDLFPTIELLRRTLDEAGASHVQGFEQIGGESDRLGLG